MLKIIALVTLVMALIAVLTALLLPHDDDFDDDENLFV